MPLATVGIVGYDIYVDDNLGGYFATNARWDEAGAFIEKHTPVNTALRRLAEEGKTDQPRLASAMLVTLLQLHEATPDIRRTLHLLQRWLLKGEHDVMILAGVEN